jgi:iron complex outermembrane receptor protein
MSKLRSVGAKRSLTFLNTLLLTSAFAVPAFAQIETVVVTAEKRAEDVQTVPVAISVFNSEKRDAVGIQSIQDMTNFTPGLQYNTSTDRISLRGVGRMTNVLSADASVANYDDGLYETFAVAAGRSSLDLDRVEVLRGPQGTLYGRNAIAGALNEVTKRPTDTFQAEVRGAYGSYNHTTLEGAISGPFSDVWSYRLYGSWEQQTQGWAKSIIPGNPGEGNVINEWYTDAQIQAKWSHLDMWTKIQAAQWHNGAGGPGAASGGWTPADPPSYEYGVASTGFNAGYGCTVLPGGRYNTANTTVGAGSAVTPLPAATACDNPGLTTPWRINRLVPYSVKLPEYFSLNSQWTYHTDADFDVKYIGGGTYYHYILNGPTSPGAGVPIGAYAPIASYVLPGQLGVPLQVSGTEAFKYQELNGFVSNELNFISTGDSPLQWVAGVYQYHQHYTQPVYTTDPDQPQWNGPYPAVCTRTGGVCAPSLSGDFRRFDNRPSVNADSYAAYGQLDWQATDEFKFTGGIRYSADRKYGTESVRLICFTTRACLGGTPVDTANPFAYPDILGGISPPIDLTQVGSVVDSGAGSHPSTNALPRGVTGATVYDGATGFASRRYNASWGALTGTAGVEWTPDEDTLAYAKYSRGYKSGGFNIGIFTVLSFQPWTDAEHVDSFEVGAKKTFGDWLVANVAVFHYHYTNLQIPLATIQTAGGLAQSQTAFFNVPSAVSQGVELETQISPIDNLAILFNYSYLDAHTTRGVASDPADPNATALGANPLLTNAQCRTAYDAYAASYSAWVAAGSPAGGAPNSPPCAPDIYTTLPAAVGSYTLTQFPAGGLVVIPGAPGLGWNRQQNLAGNALPNSPKNKVAVNLMYNINTDIGVFTPSISYIWRDKQYGTLFERSYNAAPSWDEVDARIRYVSENEKYEFILYGKNIFDKIGYDSGAYGTRLAGTVNQPCGPFCATETNFVQGVNGPVGYNTPVRGAKNGVISTYSVTPPAMWGVELHYKFD